MEFKEYKIKDIAEIINGRAYKQEELLNAGKYKVLRVGNFFTSEKWYYSNLELDDEKYCNKGDLLYAWSANFGPKIWEENNTIFHYHIWKFKLKDGIDRDYLYYKLLNITDELKKSTHGSVMMHLTKKEMEDYAIKLPSYNIQKKVGLILSSIDKKIEENSQTNNNLYEIGKALYQEYFENEEYTNNYEIRQLREVTTNNRNKIGQTKEYKVLSAVNTGNLVLSDDYFDKQVYSKDIGKYLNVNKNDFAYNPARINIGSIGLNTFDFNCCVSPVYVTFSVDKDYIDFFDFYFKSKRFNAEVTLKASGSVRQALNYNDFGMIEIPYPTKEMIEKFNSSYKTIKERININKTKISNLEQLRDTLLPKLMNGEIDLDKIEV